MNKVTQSNLKAVLKHDGRVLDINYIQFDTGYVGVIDGGRAVAYQLSLVDIVVAD